MTDMLSQGFIAALTVIYLLSYVPVRRVFGYAFIADILITGTFIWMFAGSYAGMMTGVIAGLMVSAFLRIGGAIMGREKLRLVRAQGELTPRAIWMRED